MRKKKKPIIIKWNGFDVSIKFKGLQWMIEPLEDQHLSPDDKLSIMKYVIYSD